MTIKQCLDSAETQGAISPDERDALEAIYEQLVKVYGSADAAKVEMVARMRKDVEDRNRVALVSEAKRREVETLVLSFRDVRGQPDPAKALLALIEHHGQWKLPDGFTSVAGEAKAIERIALGRLEEFLHEFRPTKVTGQNRNLARQHNVVREMAGEDTGDEAAKHFATSVASIFEDLRQAFNAEGGAIAKLPGWFAPQKHDRLALIRAGEAAWTSFIEQRLDPSRMRHPLTGKPMTPADVSASLKYIYDNISSDGRGLSSDNQASLFGNVSAQRRGMGAISNQRTDHRFLVFKDADAWLEYQAEFGGGSNVVAAVTDHIRGMAEDIAAMRVLGPNPEAMITYLSDFVMKQAGFRRAGQAAHFPDVTELTGRRLTAGGGWWSVDPESYARHMVKRTQDMWDLYRGRTGAAVNHEWADFAQGVRNVNVGSKLGGAVLSSLPDAFTQMSARAYVGLPAARTVLDVARALSGANKREAQRASLIADSYLHTFNDGARWAGSMQGAAWTRIFADRVMAFSGLNAWTDAQHRSFGLSFMGGFSEMSARQWADLPDAVRGSMQRYGIGESAWDAIRLDRTGAPRMGLFIRPADIADDMAVAGRAGERIPERYLSMILQESEYAAIKEGTLRGRALMVGGNRPGTWTGELLRFFWQFKSFSVNVALLHGERAARYMIEHGGWRGAGYAGATLLTFMLGGLLSLQLKEVAYGKDPRPLDDPMLPLAAILQSGGFGTWGDLLNAETTRMGGGVASTLAGPTAGLIHDFAGPVVSNAYRAIKGEKTTVGRDVAKVVGRYTPGSSLWYARTAWSRIFTEGLQRQLDPQAHESFRRLNQQQQKDFGNGLWWPHGETSPQRGPRISR